MNKTIFVLLIAGLILAGCDQAPVTEPSPSPTTATVAEEKSTATESARTLPSPPLSEDFQGEPQISFFPRVGETRPDQEDELFPFWMTYLDHLQRTSGVAGLEKDGEQQRFFSLRSLENVDSVGFFAPLAVQPYTNYRVSVRIKAELPEKASGGIGLLEFNEFLWIGDQFDDATMQKHLISSSLGLSVSGTQDWTEMSFSFTSGPQTRMIHLILFREGPDGEFPVLFDDLKIEMVKQ